MLSWHQPQLFYWKQSKPLATIQMNFFRCLTYAFYSVNNSTKKSLQLYNFCLNLCWGFRNFSSSKLQLWQLLEDLKTSVCVFSCTWCFAAAAAVTGIKSVAVISQPGTVRTVRVFEAHHVTILHRSPIISVLGVDLESDVRIGQPVISCHGTGESTNKPI